MNQTTQPTQPAKRPTTKSQALYEPGAVAGPLVTLTPAEWRAKYQPGARLKPRDANGNLDRKVEQAVSAAVVKNPRTVWTELHLANRKVIVNGWCYVDRAAYYICAIPFDSLTDTIEVPA